VAVTIITSQIACKTSAADAVTSAEALMVASAVKIYESDHHMKTLIVTDLGPE
jgi:isochorismate hydrolase